MGEKFVIMINEIYHAVCDEMGIGDERCNYQTREETLKKARHIASYIAYQNKYITRCTFPSISIYFRKRDHTTAIHAVNSIRNLINTSPDIPIIVEKVCNVMNFKCITFSDKDKTIEGLKENITALNEEIVMLRRQLRASLREITKNEEMIKRLEALKMPRPKAQYSNKTSLYL
jgi:hypothetical protein